MNFSSRSIFLPIPSSCFNYFLANLWENRNAFYESEIEEKRWTTSSMGEGLRFHLEITPRGDRWQCTTSSYLVFPSAPHIWMCGPVLGGGVWNWEKIVFCWAGQKFLLGCVSLVPSTTSQNQDPGICKQATDPPMTLWSHKVPSAVLGFNTFYRKPR